ncbi:hypothetical protein MYP_2442 [Sporocytophaga myxococcoides]|uniref:Uncharacterized protein n=1 Tax=Sporocytophaga myxococcoides TaxID=153721 RepID=A0A098LGK0_9BACT|nr:hypothetical protein [Sporocytophaga myxococcoides]GAL85213.1 hypothetical protein MYP_2442 [Sporocytophaga myxococcoides]
MKKYLSKEVLLNYLYSILSGRLLGFVVGTWASTVVSHFFETKSLKNLWGLKAKKTIISKSAFAELEWIVSILIGFIVFEIFEKVLKEKFQTHGSVYYRNTLTFLEEKGILQKVRDVKKKILKK